MADPTTAIALTVQFLVPLIELAGTLVEKAPSGYRSNLAIVRIDLGIVKDVVNVIQKKTQKNLPDGIQKWKEEASKVLNETNLLLKEIDQDDENNGSQTENCWSIFNRNARQLGSVKNRLRHIADRAPTVLALLASTDNKRCTIL